MTDSRLIDWLTNWFFRKSTPIYPVTFGLPLPNLTGKLTQELRSLKLEFDNGTLCDLRNTSRSSTVDISCGPKDMIISIMEDKTCHYLIKVQLAVVCKLPSFAPKKEKVSHFYLSLSYHWTDDDYSLLLFNFVQIIWKLINSQQFLLKKFNLKIFKLFMLIQQVSISKSSPSHPHSWVKSVSPSVV